MKVSETSVEVDPVHGGASSVPVEDKPSLMGSVGCTAVFVLWQEPSWSVTRSPPMQEF